MKNLLFTACLLFITSNMLFAQKSDSYSNSKNTTEKISTEDYFGFEKIRVGINPLLNFNSYRGVRTSVDFGITERINIPIQFGLLHDVFELDSESEYMRGREFKLGFQYIVSRTNRTYIALGTNYFRRKTFAPSRDFRFELFGSGSLNSDRYDLLLRQGFESTLTWGFKAGKNFTFEIEGGVGASVNRSLQKSINKDEESLDFNFITYNPTYRGEVLKLGNSEDTVKHRPTLFFNINVSYNLQLFNKNRN